MAKLPYKEGTWFAIPLRQGGYAVGLVARHVPRVGRIILAYLFGPKRETIPSIEELENLTSDMAIKKAHVGDLHLIEGRWPIIGDSPNWRRERWPSPFFLRKEDLGKVAWRVEYDDDNPNRVISERRVPYDSTEYEGDGLYGAGAAEIVVSRMLA